MAPPVLPLLPPAIAEGSQGLRTGPKKGIASREHGPDCPYSGDRISAATSGRRMPGGLAAIEQGLAEPVPTLDELRQEFQDLGG